MTEPIFTREGGTYVPSGHARGPWDDAQLHGGAPAGLLAREIAAVPSGTDGTRMAVLRLAYEFLGPVPLAPLTVSAALVKPGRRFQLVEAQLAVAGGPVVLRARAVRHRVADPPVPVPDAARATGPVEVPGGPDPLAHPLAPMVPMGEADTGFGVTGMELRFVHGDFLEPGPAVTWFRAARPLVDDEAASPLALVAMAADFGNGVSSALDFRTHLFVNTDLTVQLQREPVGEWVQLDARTVIDGAGIGLAASRLSDLHGALGTSAQSLYVEAR
ncbi:thioesterase family protein [Conexibacter sp. W3-3-2]|uniref:thioesterase family protein n=1 Tax=Conexibacter sp. W3-3-2 TaxID=2675227 RepID=UPI0018A9A85C|nr:thioesterase family protein [Conexibacter sp. W3-3-2]